MEDIEIVRSDCEVLKDTEQQLSKLKSDQEQDKQNMTREMYVLIEEMDTLMKEKSDQERNFNAVKRKMEKSLLDCQEIIDTLQKDLKASERSVAKARADLKFAQDKSKSVEDKIVEMIANSENSKKETLQLTKKMSDLNILMEQKSQKNNELQKLYTDERNKNDVNSYLKDYVEFLESEMQMEKKRKESVEFKDKVIQQLNTDHTAAIDALNLKIAQSESELESLKSKVQKKEQTILENYSTIMKQQIKINILNDSHSKSRQLAICPARSNNLYSSNSSSQNSDAFSELDQGDEEKGEQKSIKQQEDVDDDGEENHGNVDPKPYVLPAKKMVLINDPSSATTFISCMTGLEDENEKLRKEIESWEKLFKTIDIDTYLIQIENQVDELHKKNIYESRNSILKTQLELTLRGIRQLCDYHNIDMEYSI